MLFTTLQPDSCPTLSACQILLFGPMSVQINSSPMPALRTRKGMWLLAILVLQHPKAVDRSWLAATLWPDSDNADALRNLRDSLYDLRKALGDQAFRIVSPTARTLSMDLVNAEVDLLTFDSCAACPDSSSMRRAVAAYRGSLLEGCNEEWVIELRDGRQQMCIAALEGLAAYESAEAQPAAAAQLLRRCISIDPLRETAQQALMRALADAGDYAGATQVYRNFRLLMHEELQAQPASETTLLYEQIRQDARAAATQTGKYGNSDPATSAIDDSLLRSAAAVEHSSTNHNLQRPLTSFIGRHLELEQIESMLESMPLVTLTGSGGSGKTRLALQAAHKMVSRYLDGVWLIELASLHSADLIPRAVAAVFSIRERQGEPLTDTIIKFLKEKHLLLVLDNCEHLLATSAEVANTLLQSCTQLQMLVTSRERLGIPGEQVYRVPSLTLPDMRRTLSLTAVQSCEAVRLFVERARLNRPEFALTKENAPAVATLCARLDGIPLALEIAAAQVRSLSVADIVDRVNARFDQVTGGYRSVLPRHQTLRALTDWSYDMLDAQEKRLLQRLSVFPGGWTLAAAEWVATAAPVAERDVLELVTSLVDKSLVLSEEQDGAVRFRMYDTLRHYAAEKLDSSGEVEAILAKRCDWAVRLARDADSGIRNGEDHARWVERLNTELDNLRATLSCPTGGNAGAMACMALAAELWRFWMTTGRSKEGQEHLRQALTREGAQERTAIRGKALSAAGNLADNLGDYAAAANLYLESISIRKEVANRTQEFTDKQLVAYTFHSLASVAVKQGDTAFARQMFSQSLEVDLELLQMRRVSGDRAELARALVGPGHVAAELGDYTTARALLEESLSLFRLQGDKRCIAMALIDLSFVAQKQGSFAEVLVLYRESLNLKREIGDTRGAALACYEMGCVAWRQGDCIASAQYYEYGLQLFVELGDRQYIAMCLDGVARAKLALGEIQKAAIFWGAASALREKTGTPIALEVLADYDTNLALAREHLGDDEFEGALSAGRALSWQEAAAAALAGPLAR